MGTIKDVGQVLQDLIASGRTRFVMAISTTTAICFLAWKTEAPPMVYWLVAGLGFAFIASKTLTDIFGNRDKPV